MLLSIPEIVFQVVALDPEGGVILVLHFPSSTTRQDHLCCVVIAQSVTGREQKFIVS